MLVPTKELIREAQNEGYAIGAFNVYDLEAVLAIVRAAETVHSPAILQIHPKALDFGGVGLIHLCVSAAKEAVMPMAVHLDHATNQDQIQRAIDAGISSVMIDGSPMQYVENIAITREVVIMAHHANVSVEGELGHMSGSENGVVLTEPEEQMTDPDQVLNFATTTEVDFLAVCIGNVHGRYDGEPHLDFERLSAIRDQLSIPLVLHGVSGLPEDDVRKCIDLGVCKLNVNTEIREAYIGALRSVLEVERNLDLLNILPCVVKEMENIVLKKMHLFGSVGMGPGRRA